MKRLLNLKTLLIAIGLLAMSINQMWANNEYNRQYLYVNVKNCTWWFGYTDAVPRINGYDDYACNTWKFNMYTATGHLETNVWYFDLSNSGYASYLYTRGFELWRHSENNSADDNYQKIGVVNGQTHNCLWKSNDGSAVAWGYYAPPMESVTITNTSVVFGGDGSAGNPYKINKGSTITVSASSTSTVPGDAMTKYYEFYYKQGSNAQQSWQSSSTTTTSPSLTASSTAGVTYEIEVKAQNEYYGVYGTKASSKMYFVTIEPIYAILGDFNSWDRSAATWDLSDQGSNNWDASFTLTAGSYGFKVVYNSSHYGKNSTTIARNSTTASSLSTSESNITINADYTGTYRFCFNSSSHNLTVTYPTIRQVNYSVSTDGTGTGTNGSLSAKDIDDGNRAVSSAGYVVDGHRVVFTAPEAKSGYEFKGWYSATPNPSNWETNRLTTNANCTTTVSGAEKTVYAAYREKKSSITISAGSNGTLTTPSPNSSPYSLGVATKQAIVANPNTNYAFVNWTVTGNAAVDNTTSASTYAKSDGTDNGSGTVTANFAPQWTIKGGDSGSSDGNSDALGDWGTYNTLSLVSGNTFRFRVTLLANKTYYFKVYDRSNNTWYGNNSAFVGQTGVLTMSTSEGNCRLATADAGEYIFEFDKSTKALTVTYPNGTTHPSANMVYFLKPGGWGGVRYYLYSNELTTWGSAPHLSTCTIGGNTYYYAALGSIGTAAVFYNSNNDGDKTANLTSVSTYKGRYYNTTPAYASWTWAYFSNFTVTLNNSPVANSSTSVQFNGTAVSTTPGTISTPDRTGYNFDGYWSNSSCNETKVINANGTWVASAAGYTSSSKWIHQGGTATLFAKWIPKTTTVSFNQTGGTGGQTSSVTATYDAAMPSSITTPEKDGYHFEGYWDGAGGTGTMYYDADGNSATTWDKEDASFTLHARWRLKDKYTFHYGGAPTSPSDGDYIGVDAAWTGTMTPFVQEGETSVWKISSFTMPNPADKKVFVCYEEIFKSDLNGEGASSVVTDMDELHLYPSGVGIGTATGATGTLIIDESATTDNMGLGFKPDGFQLVYGSGSATGFVATDVENIYETGSVILADADLVNNFTVKIKAGASSYVTCGQSATENAATVGGRNGVTLQSGRTGKFQIDISSTADNFELKFLPVHIVSFSRNGHGVVTNQSVAHGEKITTTPSDPTTEGYYFGGWFIEDGCSNAWDFENDVVTKDTFLYAKWTAETYTINLNDRNATSSVSPSSVDVTYNSKTLASITVPTKWGSTFGGWVNGDGTVIINASGNLVADIENYTDGSGNWKRDVGDNGAELTLYALWTPKAHLYWIPGSTSSEVGNVSGAVEFTSAGGGKYYVKIDTEKDQLFHLGDGSNAAGPATPANTDHTQFTLASSASGLGSNAYWFKQTGSKQTIVYVLDLDNLTLDFENFVIYKPGDKAGDTHTAYGSADGFNGTIYGTFEYRMPVTAINKWSTLYLPFTPTNVQVYDNDWSAYYDIYPCHRKDDGYLYQGYYVIRTPDDADCRDWPIKDFKNWLDPSEDGYSTWKPTANTPYIILWQMPYFENKYISFWGNGVTISSSFSAGSAPTQDSVVNVLGNGTMATGDVKAAYVLADDYGNGAWLRDENVEATSAVGPFECYILANSATTTLFPVIGRRTQDETPTGLENIPSLSSEPYKVMIDGQLYIIRDGRMYDATGRAVKSINR